jgi:hypothetical protein
MLEERQMTGIKGFHTTAGERTAKPAKRRFTDPQAVYDVYDEFRTDDMDDARRRTKIKIAYEGGLPYSQDQLKAKGLAHMTNLSFNALKNTIDARCESITKLTADTCSLVTVAPKRNGEAGPDDARVGAILAEAFSDAIRKDGHTIAALATARREVDLYGIGPVTWPNDEAFYPLALERGQLKFRGDGPSVSSDHEIFMFESELPAEYVFMLLDNEGIAEDAGWDVPSLKRLVVEVFGRHIDKDHDSSSENGLSPDETFLTYMKMNSFYERHQFDKFSVLHVYCREVSAPRKVSHIIVPGSDSATKSFLFYKENAYDTMDQCMMWLSASTSERYARSVRGLATYLVPVERVADRMTCSIIDATFRAARLTLQQTAPGVQPAVSLSENGNTAIVAAGLEPVPNTAAAGTLQALTQARQFIAQLGTASVAGTDNAPLSTGVKVQEGGVQMSKAEAEIQERRRTLRDENLFNSCVIVHDKIFREIFRRFMNLVNGPKPLRDEYPVVGEFIEYCADKGITPEMLKEVPDRFTVEMCRDLALGADGMYQLLSATLQTTAGNLDESGRRAVVHDMYRLKFGRAAADRYCPLVSRDQSPSDQASFATLENSFIRELKPVMVGPEQWHWSHIPVHAQVLQEVQQAVQQGLAEAQSMAEQGGDVQQSPDGELAPQVEEPERLAQVLEAASAHIQEHLQFGQTQLGMKDAAQQVRDMLKGLAPTTKALNLAIATQRRVREAEQERQQREMEALQKQASEAEMQKALAKVQADKEVGLAKVQADKEVGLAKVQVDRELSAGKLQIEREGAMGRLGVETETARARAANEAAATRAGIENRRAESEAGIEAARRTQETRDELARLQSSGQQAARLLENYDRLSNVTGRNLTPPSAITAQAPGNIQEPPSDMIPM